jgi:PTH1 family peptidyl-tRNA hydrolase
LLGAARGPAVDWLVVGLGNPGREHARDRHNVGFMVAEHLRERWELPAPKQRFRGLFSEGRASPGDRDGIPAKRVALLCPLTYMNDTGRSVGPARGALRVALGRVVVVHDEIDLPFGEVRAKLGGGLAGHNGLKSVADGLGGAGFHRVRVGVGRPDSSDPDVVSAYVLGPFREPAEQVQALIARAGEEVERLVFAVPAGAGRADPNV